MAILEHSEQLKRPGIELLENPRYLSRKTKWHHLQIPVLFYYHYVCMGEKKTQKQLKKVQYTNTETSEEEKGN